MGKFRYPIIEYLLILCLGIALLLSQMSGLHMHVQHAGHSVTEPGHIVNVHAASFTHDINLSAHHPDEAQGDHHPGTVEVSADYLMQKIKLLSVLLVVAVFIGLFIYAPRLVGSGRCHRDKTASILRYYLHSPPLRAPPAH